MLYWRGENKIPDVSQCYLPHHFLIVWQIGWAPSYGWMALCCYGFYQVVPEVMTSWDDKVDDDPLNTMIEEVLSNVCKEDPANGV